MLWVKIKLYKRISRILTTDITFKNFNINAIILDVDRFLAERYLNSISLNIEVLNSYASSNNKAFNSYTSLDNEAFNSYTFSINKAFDFYISSNIKSLSSYTSILRL